MLFHLRFILHQLLDRVRVWYVAALFDAGSRCHALFPGEERGEIRDLDAGPAGAGDPAVVRDI